MIRFSLIIVLVATTSGCLEYRRDHSIVRAWADWNSFGQPSLSLEKLHHQPYKPARVDHFRWMYNRPPGKLNSHINATATGRVDGAWESPYPPDQPELHPVPPPEAVESPSLENEPSIGPLPPMPEPIRDWEPPIEEPSGLKQTSYRTTMPRNRHRGNSARFDASGRSAGSWLFAVPSARVAETSGKP